jgi:CheY-like chemotaxis protein
MLSLKRSARRRPSAAGDDRMMTAPIALGVLGALALIAIAGACVATLRARAASAALRASEAKYLESVERNRKMEAASQLAGDVAHDLDDLLTVITERIESLIASPYPPDKGREDALEIRRAALSAARLTLPLRALSGGLRAPTDAIDVNAATARAANALQRVLDPAVAETRLTTPVLVVEDDPALRELIQRVLVGAGHEVMAAAGPRAALAALSRQPAISLMLVDVVMPEMDGYDLVAEARKISPGVHAVFMSSFTHDTTRHPGGDRFLAKPFSLESLTAIVQESLDDSSMAKT